MNARAFFAGELVAIGGKIPRFPAIPGENDGSI